MKARTLHSPHLFCLQQPVRQVAQCVSPRLSGHMAVDTTSHPQRHTVRHEQGGIVYSNAVTTVSPTYAREALDGGAAGWLRSTLARPEVRAKFQVGHRRCPAHADQQDSTCMRMLLTSAW